MKGLIMVVMLLAGALAVDANKADSVTKTKKGTNNSNAKNLGYKKLNSIKTISCQPSSGIFDANHRRSQPSAKPTIGEANHHEKQSFS